jgi:hypothetical protein
MKTLAEIEENILDSIKDLNADSAIELLKNIIDRIEEYKEDETTLRY